MLWLQMVWWTLLKNFEKKWNWVYSNFFIFYQFLIFKILNREEIIKLLNDTDENNLALIDNFEGRIKVFIF